MNQNLKYLESDEVGGIIAKGLAVLYLENPQFPVDFLANWLLTYAKNQQLKSQFESIIATIGNGKGKVKDTELGTHRRVKEAKCQNRGGAGQFSSIGGRIQRINCSAQISYGINTIVLMQSISFQICDILLKSSIYQNFSGVYVGELDFPIKDFSAENDDEELAHYNLEGVKLIRYVAASRNQEFLLNKTLQPETGVSYEVLKEPQPNDEGIFPENKGLYVPDVVNDPRIIFHQWPKLGAFYVLPLTYNSVLQDISFDSGVEQRIQFQTARDLQKAEREAKLQEFEEKLESGDDPIQVDAERNAYLESVEEVKEVPFQSFKREFIIGFDTLGQDREITEEQREELLNYVKLLAESWENCERNLLSEDIDRQLKYQEILAGQPIKEILDQYQQDEDQFVEGNLEKLEEIKERSEKEYQYEIDCLRLDRLKEQLADRNYTAPFTNLAEYRYLKFPGILQSAFYLLGYSKADINTKDTNQLNWKYVRQLLNDNLLDKLLAYNHRGPREPSPYSWCLINRIQKKLEKIEQEQVDNYNLVYGRLLRYLVLICKLRRLDIEIRREKIVKQRELIENLKLEVGKIQEERERLLQEAKDQLTPEELEEWNQEEWDANFDVEHPIPEVPEWPQVELDGDYVFEELQQ